MLYGNVVYDNVIFRMFSGKPSEGTIAKILDLKNNKEVCNIRSVLIEKNCSNTAKMFMFMIKQTHEPELRFDKVIKFLSSEYYNNPKILMDLSQRPLIKILKFLKNF